MGSSFYILRSGVGTRVHPLHFRGLPFLHFEVGSLTSPTFTPCQKIHPRCLTGLWILLSKVPMQGWNNVRSKLLIKLLRNVIMHASPMRKWLLVWFQVLISLLVKRNPYINLLLWIDLINYPFIRTLHL